MILPCFSRRGYIIYALSWRARDDVSAGMQEERSRLSNAPVVRLRLVVDLSDERSGNSTEAAESG
jgi:hypothetical protein